MNNLISVRIVCIEVIEYYMDIRWNFFIQSPKTKRWLMVNSLAEGMGRCIAREWTEHGPYKNHTVKEVYENLTIEQIKKLYNLNSEEYKIKKEIAMEILEKLG